MNRERFVLHLNVADFAVAVERIVDRTLSRSPVIVAPMGATRTVVYDMSEEAYDDGVRKGMPLRQAQRLSRRAKIVSPRPELYDRAMKALVAEAKPYSPLLEHGSGDGHLYLDLTGTHRLLGAPADVGWRLRRQMRDKLGIEPIWSLAGNKLVAKVASRLVKPAGEYIVGSGEEAAFLAPLPVPLLPGLTPAEQRLLQECNIRRIGQLAALSITQLQSVFGGGGDRLFRLSRGLDEAPVRQEDQRPPTIELEQVFADDVADRAWLAGVVSGLAVRLGMQLRTAGLAVRRLVVQLWYTDGAQTVRHVSVKTAVADDFALRRLALQALDRAWGRRIRVRRCRLCGECLQRSAAQLRLFADPSGAEEKRERLVQALDTVRHRFGRDIIRFGNQPRSA
ncbi:DNA polymerase Y family protein [Desulfofustis limnaeus]|jgi:DNA polymerase-4|uniref:DNA polymerase IV 1 n=1 Tax=Desulfofustis limnaeus TaxID=2740163 RepID=A0ABN6LZ11_9BACT|nr:hypothetical protein [Desulfofustis limnaeus]MDX9895988.1 hypothetical protein [Desulfofustis sp.]BDD85846.1 DNA polymerase IV 1 [Desulfofustis limnaeus]